MMSHQPAPATAGAQAPPPTPSPLAKKIHSWVKGQLPCHLIANAKLNAVHTGNYDSAMVLVAQIEIVILIRVTLGVLAFQNSLFTPIFYAHFLRVRYYHSNFSRDTIGAASRFIDNLVAGPSFPPVARTAWGSAKSVISRWGSSSVITPAQPNGAAQPQAANANAAGAR